MSRGEGKSSRKLFEKVRGNAPFFWYFGILGGLLGLYIFMHWSRARGYCRTCMKLNLPSASLKAIFSLKRFFFNYFYFLRLFLVNLVDVSDIFYFFSSGRGRGSPRRQGGRCLLKMPGGGISQERREGSLDSVCGELGGGGGPENYFRGWKSHQVKGLDKCALKTSFEKTFKGYFSVSVRTRRMLRVAPLENENAPKTFNSKTRRRVVNHETADMLKGPKPRNN